MELSAKEIVEYYQLEPHPEGGFYKETYRAGEQVKAAALPGRFNSDKSFSTAIYFLLEHHDFSAFHKIKSDECWHFYAGNRLNIYVIDEAGNLTTIHLGNDIAANETFQHVVKAGCWFASEPALSSDFCFVGCTVAPGFDFEDFELAERSTLTKIYPQHKELIERLTR
jgi:predicted cupin superfamily sugar epimerase